MTNIRDEIIKSLEKITGVKDINLEFPDNPEFGDYTTNVAMQGSGQGVKDKSPIQIAEEIAQKLKADSDLAKIIEKINVAKPGFINFWLKKDVLVDNLIQIESEKEEYGKGTSLKGKKLMVEFAHPNTHKAFHIGHLRNITTGECLSRLFESSGAKIIRANYQGDVGLHIAKALWGINKLGFADPKDVKARVEFLGKAYATGSAAYEEDEKAKNEIHEINGKIYSKEDQKLNLLYQETRKWSLDYFESIYKRVYVKYDRLFFESECFEKGKSIAEKALKDGILEKSEGAVVFPGEKYDLHSRVFITSLGIPTYEAKDLGLAELQFSEFDPDKILHIVGPEQSGYFQVLFKALELIMPNSKGKELHIPYGWVKLKEGKMSSRTGNVVLGEWLLDEAKKELNKVHPMPEKVAEAVAVGAVKYSFLKTGIAQELAFDLKESISLEGNSGPYLQYTIARCNSVILKSANLQIGKFTDKLEIEEEAVLRSLIHFSEVIQSAGESYSPNLLCNYLYDLAQKYNHFYNLCPILTNSDQQVINFRLSLTSGVGQILKNGLKLLGIQAPERM
jgi:arginyl-tRNA synthetase